MEQSNNIVVMIKQATEVNAPNEEAYVDADEEADANADVDVDVDVNASVHDSELETEAESSPQTTLQQLKAKKNKSNLFLIKSYSFIEKTNKNNMSRRKAAAKLSTVSVPNAALLASPHMQPFADIESMLLDQVHDQKESRPAKAKKQKKISKTKDNSEAETETQLRSLLRRKSPAAIHEYEQMHQHACTPMPAALPRPQSLPAKVHFEIAATAQPTKRSSANIKRESFIRQSLQSIRRSFGSNKHSHKLHANGNATAAHLTPAMAHNNNNCSSSCSTSSTSSSCSSGSSTAAISLLAKAAAHNRRLDECVPLPVVVLLNDGEICDDVQLRSASSVITLANGPTTGTDERATTSMAPLQLPAARSADGNAGIETETAAILNEQQQKRQQQYCQQLSLPETHPIDVIKDRSLRHSYSSALSPLVQFQPSGSVRSLASSSQSSNHSSGSAAGNGSNNGVNTAKQHDQQTSAVAAISSTSAAAGVNGASAALGASTALAAAPPEKEKKRKEVSSSRVKKFHRHFSQVSKDEKLINYFSCALVSDILLQGHLYITEQHFAFYSNVFGYVTKVVIPTSSVTKISKEKTAKIIPNAVGVATADERHVFGSFISRESAFRLMSNVCSQLAPNIEILPKQLPADIEISEEYFIEDDSSCSISGNESPPQLLDSAAAAIVAAEAAAVTAVGVAYVGSTTEAATLRQRHSDNPMRHSEIQPKNSTVNSLGIEHAPIAMRSSAPPGVLYETQPDIPILIVGGSQSSSTSNSVNGSSGPSSSSSPITVVGAGLHSAATNTANLPATPRSFGDNLRGFAQAARSRLSLRLLLPTELHILYLGVMLAVMLALFSVFLLYRILDIEAKTSLYNTPVDFNWRSGNDEDIFAEALRWQKELQTKSTEEAQHILSKNLEQISKVRRSLETLSMLIHDRSSALGQMAEGQAQALNTPTIRDDSD